MNGAATGHLAAFEEETEEQIDAMLGIIFKGAVLHADMVGAMKQGSHAGRGGSIITVSSAVADIMSDNHLQPYGRQNMAGRLSGKVAIVTAAAKS